MSMHSKLTPQAHEVKQSQARFMANPGSLYVHIPFCIHHCHYCDFAVVAGQDHLADAYLQALNQEIDLLGDECLPSRPLTTVFFGGGTPTQLSAQQLQKLIDIVRNRFPLSDQVEWSVEANPEGLSLDKIKTLADGGVNRISLGIQSMSDTLLHQLERHHSHQDILAVLDLVHPYFTNVAVDLIFGIPGQTPDDWEQQLEWLQQFPIKHVSTYGLTYEKGTRLWKARQQGAIMPVAEDLEAQMYRHAMCRLPELGFQQYEISNFAQSGWQCQHNETYWSNQPHYGFGLGAARYLNGCRSTNTRSMHTYLTHLEKRQSVIQHQETLSPQDRARETAMLNLRRVRGLHRSEFQAQTGFDIDPLAASAIAWGKAQGWLHDDGVCIALTREGRLFADEVLGRFLLAE